jgi:hypothetical protein
MTERQDRRTPGVNRVPVARLVDICGRDPSVPAFEAESVELSGRGMHVKTPYLPPLGAPLVCRLEDDGREIVVEGVVAWQAERSDGGEFGVQFTALDSGSVEALKALCGIGPKLEKPAATVASPKMEPEVPGTPEGSPVKLHIDGLGAPMKARVKGGNPRKLQVGSNLEFLKVGKNLQIEDVEHGEKRGARIDAVSIALDPETQVPQLVVVLRYEGEDKTPEPSVVGGEAAAGARLADDSKRVASAVASTEDDHDEDDDAEEAAAMRGPVDQFAASVGKRAIDASQKLAEASGVAAKGLARLMQAGGSRLFAKGDASAPKRRSTAPAPQTTVSREPRLRPQNGPAKEEETTSAGPSRRKAVAILGAASVLVLGALAFGFSSRGTKAPATSRNAESSLESGNSGAAAQSVPMAGVTPSQPGAQNGTGMRGVTANVPLFGPTPMATLEPAPLGPSPDEISATAPKAVPTVPSMDEERLDDEDVHSAKDESFDDGSSKKKDKDKDGDKDDKSPDAIAEAVKPFGLGKMHLPVVYKMKLDKPGAALDGRSQGSGFTVTIPGRKVETSATAITKRDDRIAEVKAKNGPTGAVITFVFRSKVPGYKVRLRKNAVEFFISSPDSAK